MTMYTATDGTQINVTQIVPGPAGGTGVFKAVYSGLTSPSGLADTGYGTSDVTAMIDLYQAAHSRQLSGSTPDISTHNYR